MANLFRDYTGKALRLSAGVLIIFSLISAPWLYGGTRVWAVEWITWMLGSASGFWLLEAALAPSPPTLPRTLKLGVLWLVIISGTGLWFRPSVAPDSFMAEQIHVLKSHAPNNFISLNPWQAWKFIASLLGGMLVMADLARDLRWWNALCWTVLLTGSSIAVLGIVQVFLHSQDIFEVTGTRGDQYFFATFFHYTPAGAFLNLTWPLILGTGFAAVFNRNKANKMIKCLFLIYCISLIAASWIALFLQRSKAAQGLGAIIGFMMLCAALIASRSCLSANQPVSFHFRIRWALGFIAILALSFASLQLPIFATSRGRWHELWKHKSPLQEASKTAVVWDSSGRGDRLIESNDPTRGQLLWDRRLAWGTALRMIQTRPWLGFGLKGWSNQYYHFTDDPMLKTFYLYMQFTHQDCLQCLVEWGVLGAAGWLVVIIGGLRRGLAHLRGGPGKWSKEDWKSFAMSLSLGALFLHGCIDYPLQVPSLQLFAATFVALLWARGSHVIQSTLPHPLEPAS